MSGKGTEQNLKWDRIRRSPEEVTIRGLQIKPVGKFEYERPVSGLHIILKIVFSVHHEEIWGWLETPLKAGIEPHIVVTCVVLHDGSEKKFVGKGRIDARTDL